MAPDLDLRHGRADADGDASEIVPRDTGEDERPDDADQVPCDGVQISVADASECLVDLNFVRAEVAAGEGHGLEVAVGGGARHV